jgi:succinoglycan biosynthesis protein ExoM
MMAELPHIRVCICSYKRPKYLRRLLEELERQETKGLFTFSIAVADNDRLRSAEPVVSEFAATSEIPVLYRVEPRQNISMARNKALEGAPGEYVAFIDDDEFPEKSWLLTLFTACIEFGVDGVLGPVKPYFEEQPPQWVVKGKLCERATYDTGFRIAGKQGRTGNVLLRTEILDGVRPVFNPNLIEGEDQDFFQRMIEESGHVFVWCNEAVAYEIVPPIRWKRSFILRRSLMRGKGVLKRTGFGLLDVAKSMVAVPSYALLVPVFLLFGHHVFIRYLEKLVWHTGVLGAAFGFLKEDEQYITE